MTQTLRGAASALAVAVIVAGCSSQPPQPQLVPPQNFMPQSTTTPEANTQYRAKLHTDLGAGYYSRGRLDVALEELNEAIRIDPNYAPAYNTFGLVYTVLGDNAKAEQSFQRALGLAPNDPETLQNWGWYLCEHGREREGIPLFERAARDPLYRSPEIALLNAGRCAQGIADIRTAEGYYRRTLAVQPSNVLANFGLADIAYKEAHYEDARRYIRAVMNTTNPPADGLLLGVCIERKLGDRQSELSYTSQLKNRFPNAPETKKLQGGGCE